MNRPSHKTQPPLGLYIHIPWCIQKCPYCDFNSHALKDTLQESLYIDALLNDLQQDLQLLGQQQPLLETIFIGGGTPSLFSPNSLDRLLSGIQQQIVLSDNVEITMEANPGTFESSKFAEFNALGINRLSIGIQSFNDQHLKTLGRVHSAAEALKAIDIAFKAGFDNINLDLMFGLPEQQQSEAIDDIKTAIKQTPTHISFYQLTLEPNTYFHKFPPKLPEDDVIFITQKNCQLLLQEHGYLQYEVSAYGQKNFTCRHNINYWQFGDYLGIGAGAHGKISQSLPNKILRTVKSKNPEYYLHNLQATQQSIIQAEELPLEFMMNQLRLKQGFSLDSYHSATGLNSDTLEPALSDCVDEGLLLAQNGYYRCSGKGWDFLDIILEKFVREV